MRKQKIRQVPLPGDLVSDMRELLSAAGVIVGDHALLESAVHTCKPQELLDFAQARLASTGRKCSLAELWSEFSMRAAA